MILMGKHRSLSVRSLTISVTTLPLAIRTKENNWCFGSDTVVTYAAVNLVRDNAVPEVRYMLSAIIFPAFYVGLVFVCVALTVLSVQQLSDSTKYRFRYDVLRKLGLDRRELSKDCAETVDRLLSVPGIICSRNQWNHRNLHEPEIYIFHRCLYINFPIFWHSIYSILRNLYRLLYCNLCRI